MSLSFCPTCANLLLVELLDGQLRYYCQTCAYIYDIDFKISRTTTTALKKHDDVLTDEAAKSTSAQTEVSCSTCKNDRAYYTEVQTRSADEAATLFYTCTKCGHKWKEG